MFYVISYDIPDDKRRNKVAKILENYAYRVQYSVFEIICDEIVIKKIIEELNGVIDKYTDSVRVYFLCNSCVRKVNILGVGEVVKDLDVYVV